MVHLDRAPPFGDLSKGIECMHYIGISLQVGGASSNLI
jgi:hypothetical protein